MRQIHRTLAIATLTLSIQPSCVGAVGTRPAITVRIYDYAGLSEDSLAEAGRTVGRLLAEAGIEVRAVPCRTPGGRVTHDECGGPLEATDLLVRLMPGIGSGDKHQLGASIGTKIATVYYQRAMQFAAEQPASERVPTAQITGYAIVHEIGHLLLPMMPHSPSGIMRAGWSKAELRSMRSGNLRFNVEQAEAIQREVRQLQARHAEHQLD